ncbi:polysaccharide deacetylase family protein [bacterium]|nr:polysaccharide deacetylase family protein [bacterium]
MTAPRHAMSVDVEDWFHDGGLAAAAGGGRVERNTDALLEQFAAAGARATFFVLGAVAERHPALVRRIADAGHELASHGHAHHHLANQLWREFRADVERARRLLEDVSGRPVRGYRAPYFAIRAGVRWPIEQLAAAGYSYDSSVLPNDRPPGLELVSPRQPYRHHNGLWEVPVAVLRLCRFWHLPAASGWGLRLLPPRLLAHGLRGFERDVGSGVFYLHPWELDPDSPSAPGAARWLLRAGRARLAPRLERLLRARAFGAIRDLFPQVAAPPGEAAPWQ